MQLWATGDTQLHHGNMPARAFHLVQRFFVKHQITQVSQAFYSRDLAPCDFWLFPKTKITFEREEISDHLWDSGKYDGVADGDWENCVRSQGACFEGDWGIIVLCTMFLVPFIFFKKYLYFSYYITGYLLDRPLICSLCLLPLYYFVCITFGVCICIYLYVNTVL